MRRSVDHDYFGCLLPAAYVGCIVMFVVSPLFPYPSSVPYCFLPLPSLLLLLLSLFCSRLGLSCALAMTSATSLGSTPRWMSSAASCRDRRRKVEMLVDKAATEEG